MTDVTVYSTFWCPYCSRAKALLDKKGVKYTEIDVGMDPAERDRMIERSGGRRTVPQIFIGARHVGGSDDLHALDRSGQLDALLAGA